MKGRGLGEARKLFRARRFPDVIRVLEPEVFRYRESYDYFYLLGFSCLQTGDLGGAFSYLSRAHQLDKDAVNAILGLAAIHLRRHETEQAVKRWLEVLEIDPADRIARRGMDVVRRGLTPEKLQEFIDTGRMKTLYPGLPPRGVSPLVFIVPLAVLAAAGAVTLGLRMTAPSLPERPGVSAIEIPSGLASLTDTGSGFTYVLTERQVREAFQKAKSWLLKYRDNLAGVEINRILLSNAALPVKERARLLKGFITQPTFLTLKDSFPYETVMKEPALYDGCSVSWKGKIANLAIGRNAITFDLLVGYEQEKELQGIVPVMLPFAVDLANGGGIEVLGQISAAGGRVSLTGISVHKLAGN